MRIIIKSNENEVGKWVADHVVDRIKGYVTNKDEPFTLGLPTGSSPIPTYKELIERNKTGHISFKNVLTFNMDEYVGLPEGHPESYHTFMQEQLFAHTDFKKENLHIPNGNAQDLDKECQAYEKKITQFGGIDLFLAGVGQDGHIAFNEPGSSLSSRTRIKTLSYNTILANSRFFDGDISKVPTQALTVGVGTVMDAGEVLIIITGYNKARALRNIVEGSVSHMWPASVIQMHPKAILVCDEPSTMELKVETVEYFKDIEQLNHKKFPSK
ncbi:MAG: glucosamine-6-phosphate deaminase [Bacteroidota bacterium]